MSPSIVYRDLKPGNVMLTKSGVKLLDFGPRQGYHSYDVAPDGNRFLVNAASEAEQPRAALVVNWDADMNPMGRD